MTATLKCMCGPQHGVSYIQQYPHCMSSVSNTIRPELCSIRALPVAGWLPKLGCYLSRGPAMELTEFQCFLCPVPLPGCTRYEHCQELCQDVISLTHLVQLLLWPTTCFIIYWKWGCQTQLKLLSASPEHNPRTNIIRCNKVHQQGWIRRPTLHHFWMKGGSRKKRSKPEDRS